MENSKENITLSRNKITTSKQFRSMLVYISKSFFKKPSTYIMFGIFSSLILLVALIGPIYARVNNDPKNSSSAFELAMIILTLSLVSIESAIFAIVKTCSIFLDTQDEGFEIIIVSKPLSRNIIFFSRLLFLMLFGLFISIFNMTIIAISCSISQNIFIDINKGSIIGGSLGTQLLTFILFFSLTLIFGLLIGAKAGRIIPIVIFIASFVGNNVISALGQVAQNPINKINEQLSQNVNDKISKLEGGGFDYNGKKIGYIDFSNAFQVSDNYIYFNSIDLLQEKNSWTHNYINYDDLYNDSNSNIITDKQIVEGLFEEMHNISSVNGSVPIIAATYLNPMSAIMNISNTNNLNFMAMGNNSLDIMYKYSNLAPKSPNEGKYCQEIEITNNWGGKITTYVATYSSSKQDPAWALFLMWGAIILALSSWSYIIYIRRDFK